MLSVPLNEPPWWYATPPDWRACLLWPLGGLYGLAASARLALARPYQPRIPVICVGNFTAGGTGKTPAAIAIAGLVRDLGREPVFLSRGYGGSLRGPVYVDLDRHTAQDVGDEPLLLARAAPAVVALNRAEGARLIEEQSNGRTVIVMDDGLQNPKIAKNLTIAVVDGKRGLGNGWTIPAGPLRAPLRVQARLAGAVILNGAEAAETEIAGLQRLRTKFSGPILRARAEPASGIRKLKGARLLAYAGIANPGRFFAMLENLGAEVAGRAAFRDHHPYTTEDAESLLAQADTANATLITTEKDLARLYGASEHALQRLAAASAALPIRLVFDDGDAAVLLRLIGRAVQRRPG